MNKKHAPSAENGESHSSHKQTNGYSFTASPAGGYLATPDSKPVMHNGTLVNNYIRTSSRRKIYPFGPYTLNEYSIEDIAHALSNICRFTGHTCIHYSVAEHCLRVVRLMELLGDYPHQMLLTALMHDAAEAYLNDLATPVKVGLPTYIKAEKSIEAGIAESFGLIFPIPYPVKDADRDMLYIEQSILFGNDIEGCEANAKRLGYGIPQAVVRELFKSKFYELRSKL